MAERRATPLAAAPPSTTAPMLQWQGRRAAALPDPAEVRVRETFDPEGRRPLDESASGWNRLFHADNLPVLHTLAQGDLRGRFKLIYADPPYGSGVLWTSKVRLRGPQREYGRRLLARLPEYDDAMDDAGYLQFMLDRLVVLRDLLAPDGVLWLHCDHRHAHHLRALLDELFGAENWLNSITWRSQTARGAKSAALFFPNSAHTLHVFARDRRNGLTWNAPKRRTILTEAEAAAEFMRDDGGFFRTSDPGSYTFESLKRLHAEGRLYAPYGGVIVIDEERRRIYCSHGGNVGIKYYLTDLGRGRHQVERTVDNIWDDIPGLGTTPGEDTGYPTQKTSALLERIIQCSTNPGDWVLDPFVGSGTTLVAAQRQGRRWVGVDAGERAIQVTTRRLYATINEQIGAGDEAASGATAAAQNCFAVLEGVPAASPEGAPAPGSTARGELLITQNALDATRIQCDVSNYGSAELEGLLAELPLGALVEWRALVDAIAIDPDFDGTLFRAQQADAPLRRNRFVSGSYEILAPPGAKEAAIRFTDILGRQTISRIPLVRHEPG